MHARKAGHYREEDEDPLLHDTTKRKSAKSPDMQPCVVLALFVATTIGSVFAGHQLAQLKHHRVIVGPEVVTTTTTTQYPVTDTQKDCISGHTCSSALSQATCEERCNCNWDAESETCLDPSGSHSAPEFHAQVFVPVIEHKKAPPPPAPAVQNPPKCISGWGCVTASSEAVCLERCGCSWDGKMCFDQSIIDNEQPNCIEGWPCVGAPGMGSCQERCGCEWDFGNDRCQNKA
eukprot:c8648_g1_i1.p1 GENE.c8648_g1_i1~~c8648_g1_i1.p1  ORF type:complete len:233 (+),score=33.18 c8648_g1_i1:43-741(+)